MVDRGDRALASFGDALRRARARRRRLAWLSGLTAIGCLALLEPALLPSRPRLLWNASASMPIGLYRVGPAQGLRVGDLAIAFPPALAAAIAAARRYVPRGVPLLKDVAATAGQRVCAGGALVSVDGWPVALRHRLDRRGRPLPWWSGCRRLGMGDLFLLGRSADSFDGRYFGPTDRLNVLGRAVPLWLR